MWPRTSYLAMLCLSFLIHKMGVINIIYYVETVERIKWVNKFSAVPCPT